MSAPADDVCPTCGWERDSMAQDGRYLVQPCPDAYHAAEPATLEGRDVVEVRDAFGTPAYEWPQAADWVCTVEDFFAVNEVMLGADATEITKLAVGESCLIGGGASPLVRITRAS